MTEYHLSAPIRGAFEQARETLFALLQENGLSVVSDVNVQAILENKLGKKMRPVHIYGACNAKLAERIVDAEPTALTLLPCTFVLREENDSSCIASFMHPKNILGLAEHDEVQAVAALAQEKIEKIVQTLHQISE
ncbi:MAG: DUF302 domain-containing protein [Neisseriaceae bacterium]|nr:DUF302 domain-containing protein [Neisseriaceae bacterium]